MRFKSRRRIPVAEKKTYVLYALSAVPSSPPPSRSRVPPVGLLEVRREPVLGPDRARVLRAVPRAGRERRDVPRVFREKTRERRRRHLNRRAHHPVQHGLELATRVADVVPHVVHAVGLGPGDLHRRRLRPVLEDEKMFGKTFGKMFRKMRR